MSPVGNSGAAQGGVQAGAGAGLGAVTVTVTNWNGAAFLDDCLDALAALQGEIAEVIVVDNASTDGSPELVRRRGARLSASGPPLRLLSLPENRGPCPARNLGLREARTRWVLQLDSDVLVRPDTLLRLLPEAALPGVAAVQPRAVFASDPGRIHYDGGRMHYVGMLTLDHFLQPVAGATTEPQDVDAVISMALLLDRQAVLAAGAYDESFFILFEDHDLSYRLRSLGHRLRRVPAALVLHREGTAGISFRPGAPAYPARRAFLHARNRSYLVLKNYSWPALLLSWPGRLLYALLYMGFAARRGVLGSYLQGRWEFLRLLPRALAHRRALAARRVVGDGALLGADDLSVSPLILRSRLEAALEKTFNAALRAWWRLARRFLPAGPGSA
ncbi:MAG: glycosyltransferase family 2 protein [Planctomycetota bacterium]